MKKDERISGKAEYAPPVLRKRQRLEQVLESPVALNGTAGTLPP